MTTGAIRRAKLQSNHHHQQIKLTDITISTVLSGLSFYMNVPRFSVNSAVRYYYQ